MANPPDRGITIRPPPPLPFLFITLKLGRIAYFPPPPLKLHRHREQIINFQQDVKNLRFGHQSMAIEECSVVTKSYNTTLFTGTIANQN